MRNVPKYFRVEPSDNTLILSATDRINRLFEQEMREECEVLVDELSQHNAANLVIDLGAIDHLDSVMLELIVFLWKHVKKGSGKFVVCNVPEIGKQVLRTTKLDTCWTNVSSRAEALTLVH